LRANQDSASTLHFLADVYFAIFSVFCIIFEDTCTYLQIMQDQDIFSNKKIYIFFY